VRLQLTPGRAPLGALAVVTIFAGPALAENLVTVRSVYFRETSTRVVQPVVEIEKDLPDGFGVRAHYLLDAITSASASAGTGVDEIFTEFRNEAGLSVSSDFDRTRVRLGYKYSAESDYWSHAPVLALAQRLLDDTVTLQLSAGASFDSVTSRARTPACAKAGSFSCSLDTYFGGVGATWVLSPVVVGQASYELAYQEGFLANPYRSGPNVGYETLPDRRTRHAASARVAFYHPPLGTGVQLHGRDYWDNWDVTSWMAEGRVYQELTRNLEVRLSYRWYSQSAADFWCDWMARPDCYGPAARVYAFDPKLGKMGTHMPEVKLMWEAAALRGLPVLGWFAPGTFEISYGRFIQNTTFGDAHLAQVGYALPY
jgi:hypothetical protein